MIRQADTYLEGRIYYYGETQVPDTLVSQDYKSRFKLINPIIHVVKQGERLVDISYKYYGNHNLWFVIASFNRDKIINPLELEEGTELILPDISLISTL